MSKRAPNENESKLHQAALSAPNKEITPKQCESIVRDPKARQDALNFLLGVGLFKSLADKKGALTFRAVSKEELKQSKELTGEEDLVLGHIRASHNEGIWTKHLKAKTNFHQTVIDRCLKTLQQKQLIRKVQSVQHPTRKIFMLAHLEPSIALTGGPWYTDNELDTEFIETLVRACFKIVQEKSFPKQRSQRNERALYPISKGFQYPTAEFVQKKLREARITPTELSVEHVEMLLNVLVLDGEIEKLPGFGASMWDSNALDEDEASIDERRSKKKRKHRQSHPDPDDGSSKRNSKKKYKLESDTDTDTGSDVVKKSKRRKTKDDSESDSDSERSRTKKSKKRRDETDPELESSDDDAKRKKRKSKKRTESSEGESSSDSDDERGRRQSKTRSTKRSSSPPTFSFDDYDDSPGSGSVYRAIRQERLDLGWSQAPCSVCPSFEFCKDDGPVNPRDCVYYGDWLVGGTVAAIEDTV
ncbi:rna polymerase iii subunit rpc34 [Moniliophthora roreri MCA 2997]|uniref:Rna polymerase iii subunit rpc34 n=2 Tax=Moniliophthora roreri TaxID=221103 RepID=V2Z0I9_MONRO|nr:rna polymerase iii subunit rpc34 [Moniliophthora roreri MCA 2997]KAI3596731.1 rna polymerase iii subunit rpc34 [Moniliophthora roreri]